MVDAQAVAGAEVLVDPHPHEGQATGRRWPERRERRAEAPAPTRDRPQYAARVLEPPVAKRVAHTWDRPTGRSTIHGRGWPIATIPTRSPTSRPRTPTPTPGSASTRRSSTPSSTRSRRGRRRTTRPSPPARGRGGTPARTVEGLAYPIHCRGGTAATATEVVLLDENDEAGDGLLRARRLRREPGSRPARVVGRPQRSRGLRDAHPGPRRGHRPAGPARGHVLRHGVVGRRALPLLHPAGPRHAPLPGLAPRDGDGARRRRARLRGARRALQRRPRAVPERRVRHHHQRGQHVDRRARAPRHPAAGRAAARGRAPAGRRVPVGPLGRPLRHPHQPRRPGLQGRHRALRQPGAGRVGRPRAPPGRAPDHPGRAVRRPPRAARVVRRARAHPHPPQRRLRADPGLRRPGPLRRHRRQPRVPHADGPLHLRVPGDAALGLRRRRLDRRPPAAQAGPGARRLRPCRLRVGAANGRPRPTARWSPSTSSGSGARRGTARRRCRCTATAPTSTPGRRGSRSSACRSSTAVASGPSPTPVAAASSAGRGTSTASSSTSGTPSPTSSPAPSTWSSRATARRTGSRPAAGAPAACSSGPASPCGPSSTPA